MPTVLITGCSSGFGLEFARAYAAEGWKVIATCRAPGRAADLKSLAGDVLIRGMDVTKLDQVMALAGELVDVPIDLLINNAGMLGPRDARGTFGDMDVEAWVEVLRVNAIAPLKVTEAFLPHVKAGALKKIVFMSSRAGSITERGSQPHHKPGGPYAYRTSKAALNAVAKAISFDLRPQGISVIILHPGWARTQTGGMDSPHPPAATVPALRQLIERASPADNGTFWNYDGTVIPW
jgi:NAD(P)-dependent dehydrogenase (short-subunit alcohol dehydrogenase family)